MKILIDFSLSESRGKLNKLLSEMRSRIALELHDAIAVHENKISEEHGGAEIAILDSEAMVNNLVEQLERKIHAVMEHPHLVQVTDPDTDIQLILEKAFLHAAHYLQNNAPDTLDEVYVAILQRQPSLTDIIDTTCWSDILTNETMSRIRDIFLETLGLVEKVCRAELIYPSSKYEQPKGV